MENITITLTKEQFEILNGALSYANMKMANEANNYHASCFDEFREVRAAIKTQYNAQNK